MTSTRNPFFTGTIGPDQPFCNRTKEQDALIQHAESGMNVVLFAPRRYGKTSLVQRVQSRLEKEMGHCVIYAQFFRLMSVDDLVGRLAKAVFKGLHGHLSLLDKGRRFLRYFPTFSVGFSLNPDGTPSISVAPTERRMEALDRLESLLGDISRFLENEHTQVTIALDEFQDIVDLKDGRVEAILREHVQRHRAAYIFLGSRRRVLQEIFTTKDRPFYQSATMMELAPLPHEELTEFICDQFALAGKSCPKEYAAKMVKLVQQYPYYAQALAYRAFSLSSGTCTEQNVAEAYAGMLENERYGYQAIVQSLSAAHLKFLCAISVHPFAQITSSEFLQNHGLSLGGVQHATRHLAEQDIIEKTREGWKVVDPIFEDWLQRTFA